MARIDNNRATRHYSVYSNEHPHIPLTKTDYVKQGNRWKPIKVEKDMISKEQASFTLSKTGLPGSKNRLEKKDKYGHTRPYDTFTAYSPDGKAKTTFSVDFAKGAENYQKLLKKSAYDRERYKAKKNGGK